MASTEDEEELTAFVLRHYRELLSDLECRTLDAVVAEEKAQTMKTRSLAEMLRDRAGVNDPQVREALKAGVHAFRKSVRDRLLREHDVAVARCPRCTRVLKSPAARQCLRCGADWHDGAQT